MGVTALPYRVEPAPNDPILELLFDAIEGRPPARQKRMVMRWRSAGLLDIQQTDIVMSALGLRHA
jgi:hypothetical protein